MLAHLSRKINKVIVYGGQDDSANTAPWVNYLCYGKTVEEIPAAQFAFLKSLFYTYYGPTVIEITGIIDHYDPFLTSASPSCNLIPAIVAAEPGYKDALDIPLGYMPQ